MRAWLALVHLNMVEAFASLRAHQACGLVKRASGVVVAAAGSPISFFNEILPVEDHAEAKVDSSKTQAPVWARTATRMRADGGPTSGAVRRSDGNGTMLPEWPSGAFEGRARPPGSNHLDRCPVGHVDSVMKYMGGL
jgi:hypothetical protein